MTLKSSYNHIKTHLISLYRDKTSFVSIASLTNRCANRAIQLTFLYHAILKYKSENVSLDLSNREVLICMVFEDANIHISSLNDISPSLVLKILQLRFARIDTSVYSDFHESVQNMKKWSSENAEWIAQSHEVKQDLPELKWTDLPDDLFALIQDN